MGILNITPDSFSDGGRYFDPKRAVDRALEMEREGADIIDIGGQSTRPGSAEIPEEEELRRVIPVMEALSLSGQVPVSIDTYRSGVARRAIEAGAQIINDISGFRLDPHMASVASESRAGVVLTFSRGSRDALHAQPPLTDPVAEARQALRELADDAERSGVERQAIAVDPGIGFGQRAADSLKVLGGLDALGSLGYPVLVGASRKSFIRKIVLENPELLPWGTAATVTSAIMLGAHVVRVHDVAAMRAVARVTDAIVAGELF
ncbi:MAG TPA: dihydropteroate synthase [Terriglobia bacterium]|nr:dihydropteroate synthase [Terriglobia bacterium]